jgi:hypothetical protein
MTTWRKWNTFYRGVCIAVQKVPAHFYEVFSPKPPVPFVIYFWFKLDLPWRAGITPICQQMKNIVIIIDLYYNRNRFLLTVFIQMSEIERSDLGKSRSQRENRP